MELSALLAPALADVPTVIVQGHGTVAERLFADGVESAADGLYKRIGREVVVVFLPARLLQSTETTVVNGGAVGLNSVVAGEDAVFSAHNTRHQVVVAVGIGHALTVDDSLRRGAEVAPHTVEAVFYLHHLVKGDGSTGIALNAAGTATDAEVAAELFCKQVRRDKHIAHL